MSGAVKAIPTFLCLKNVKNEGYKERAARLLNIKLSPGMVAGEEICCSTSYPSKLASKAFTSSSIVAALSS